MSPVVLPVDVVVTLQPRVAPRGKASLKKVHKFLLVLSASGTPVIISPAVPEINRTNRQTKMDKNVIVVYVQRIRVHTVEPYIPCKKRLF